MADLEIKLRALPASCRRFLERHFDGNGGDDPLRLLAADIVNTAIDDEVARHGVARLSETLGAFLQYRIAEAFAELEEHDADR